MDCATSILHLTVLRIIPVSLHSCPQVLQSTADWLSRDMGYRAYTVDWASSMLYRPFAAVYFGCAYLTWLSSYGGKYRFLTPLVSSLILDSMYFLPLFPHITPLLCRQVQNPEPPPKPFHAFSPSGASKTHQNPPADLFVPTSSDPPHMSLLV